MSSSDWNISLTGSYTIVEEGNKKLKIGLMKLFLWKNKPNLVDSEITADIKVEANLNSRADLFLRATANVATCYVLQIRGHNTSTRRYILYKIIGTRETILTDIYVQNRNHLEYTKTRFRIDGNQISVEDYINGKWELVFIERDDTIYNGGYTGFGGVNSAVGCFVYFDNISIKEKEVV